MEELAHEAADLLTKQGSLLLAQILRECYTPRETYGTSFARLFARLFSQQGLILLDPLDAELHKVAEPLYSKVIEDRDPLNQKLLARGKELDAAGYAAQVKVTAKSTLLFYMGDGDTGDGPRQPIVTGNSGRFEAGKKSWSKEELLGAVHSHPENFSPSALFRAVVQDYLLPTVAYIAGPAEISYFAQSEVVYRELLGRMPVILPRPGFTLVDTKAAKLLRAYKLKVEDIWEGSQEVSRRMEFAAVPKEISRDFERNQKQLMKLLDQLKKQMQKARPYVAWARWRPLGGKSSINWISCGARPGARRMPSRDCCRDHQNFLEHLLFPHKTLQSRELCLLPFLARWGPGGLMELQKMCGSRNLGKHCIVQLT